MELGCCQYSQYYRIFNEFNIMKEVITWLDYLTLSEKELAEKLKRIELQQRPPVNGG